MHKVAPRDGRGINWYVVDKAFLSHNAAQGGTPQGFSTLALHKFGVTRHLWHYYKVTSQGHMDSKHYWFVGGGNA